jgi:hypothetical protein
MINRMVETYSSWINELHSWIYPNPMDMIHQNENKSLSPEERKEIMSGIDRIMYFIRKNKRIIFDKTSDKEEGKFIDELMDFAKEYFRPFMLKCHMKFEKYWEKEIVKDKKEESGK